jgi:TRAP-type C4-dicarboxylate transport system permease large subunit
LSITCLFENCHSQYTTITEASGFASVYAIVIGVAFYRNLTWKKIWDALIVTVRFSGVVFFVLATSAVLGWFVTRLGIAEDAAGLIIGFSGSMFIQLLLVCLLLVGTVMIVVLNIANVTPPVGMTLMTAARIADVPFERAIMASLPF